MKNVSRAFGNIMRMMDLSSLFCVVRLFKAAVKFSLSRRFKDLLGRNPKRVTPGRPVWGRGSTCLGFRGRSLLSPASCPTSHPGDMDPVIKGLFLLLFLILLPLSHHLACQLTIHMFSHSPNRPSLWAIVGARSTAVKKKKKSPICSVCITAYTSEELGIKK